MKIEQFGNSVFKFNEKDWTEKKSKELDVLKTILIANKASVVFCLLWIVSVAFNLIGNPGSMFIISMVIICIINDLMCVIFTNRCEKFNTPIFNFINKLYKSEFVCSTMSENGLIMIVDNKGNDEHYNGKTIADNLGIENVKVKNEDLIVQLKNFAMYDLSNPKEIQVTVEPKDNLFVDYEIGLV